MGNKRVTLSLDEKIYDKYIKYCREKGIILSKQVGFFIEGELKRIKENDR